MQPQVRNVQSEKISSLSLQIKKIEIKIRININSREIFKNLRPHQLTLMDIHNMIINLENKEIAKRTQIASSTDIM